jgi:GTP-binding protein
MGEHIKSAEFVAGFSSAAKMPKAGYPELAILGRSNVGKSTFLNRIAERRALARVSSTPGRTQELNLFQLTLTTESGEERKLQLVDLPGFGYAKLSKERREELSFLTVEYLQRRKGLRLVCLLNDCRRAPERDEAAVRDLAYEAEIPLLVVLTKVDKLNRKERDRELSARAKEFGLEPEDVVVSGEKEPLAPFWERVERILQLSAGARR